MKIEYIIEILPSLVSKIPVVFIVFTLSFITALILAIAIVLIRKIEIPIINTIVKFWELYICLHQTQYVVFRQYQKRRLPFGNRLLVYLNSS